MRIDDENKVVWCSESEMEWYVSLNHSFGNHYSVDVRRISDLSSKYGDKLPFNITLCERYNVIKAIANDYEFKLEQSKKYYWRKKKEHLAWFEDNEQVHVVRFKFSDSNGYQYCLGEIGLAVELTEQEARDLLKDDFDKFEKVEGE